MTVGRPREFDEDQVLERALHIFWRLGYEATSVTDLMEGTGLAKGSLYKAFGDKRGLFLKALDRYLERGRDALRRTMADAATVGEGLEAGLACAVRTACDREKKGCFGVNCIIELAPHDAEVRARMETHLHKVEALYADVLGRAVERGELRRDLEPRVAAALLSTVVNGLAVMGKASLSLRSGQAQVALLLAGWR
jgi:TetR/AcrR family transcriptional repressor of nem operon